MNQLPQIFRQTHQHSGFYRQGPSFHIRITRSINKKPSFSLDKSVAKMRTRLNANRYSVQKSEQEGKRYLGYSSISYDHLDDPEFYGTKGKKEQSESYRVMLQERWKASQIVGLKVNSCRGTKEQYLNQLEQLKNKYLKELQHIQTSVKSEILQMRQMMSQLRRETGDELKSMKIQVKQFNNDLITFCQEFDKVEKKCDELVADLEKSI